MIMRSAAVVVLRAAIVMVGMPVGMGDTLGVRRDLPMLISVNPLRHGQQRKADQPQNTERTQTRHDAETKRALSRVKASPFFFAVTALLSPAPAHPRLRPSFRAHRRIPLSTINDFNPLSG